MDHCCDEGKIWLYYVNHKTKEIGSDWVYCNSCYPGNSCSTYFADMFNLNWKETSIDQFHELRKNGYIQIDY